jgi:3-dehydroquinate dehydratase/shikimate dehydrogenase
MIRTKRLVLRTWQQTDLEPFARLNACEHVCEFLPKVLTKSESDDLAARIMAHFDKHGFGLMAVEYHDTGAFIGFTGLSIPTFNAHFMPAVEIGWRLAYAYWGKGIATEAAMAVRDYAFGELGLNELVSFTTRANIASRRVMEKIGMTHDEADDFHHPNLSKSHPLGPHVLYRLRSGS